MSETLSEAQASALFDILTHYNTYAEIHDFTQPGSLKHYGPPFTTEDHTPSTSPALQSLVSRFLLQLPGLKDLPSDFWKVQCYSLIEDLEKANLSESYDKGAVGSRKTLATAVSAIIEYPVRGTYGKFPRTQDSKPEYDVSNAEDLGRAFRDFLDQAVYGTVVEDLVKKGAETDKLADHTPLTRALHEFVLVNLASFMHYTLILSPKGQYLVKLIDNVNKLVPYVLVRQTLKIGNVASMINGLVKIGLAKMSITSVTNWMGLTQSGDEGMNLMQQIISTVLSWDNKDLESRSTKIEKDRNGPSKDQLKVLREYPTRSRADHERLRNQSEQQSISIVTAILRDASLPSDLGEPTHKQALEFLSCQLSIRDRKEIIRVFCHSSPDNLTTAVRALVSAYEPVIRQLHKAVDLADTVYDLELFVKDMLKLAKVQPTGKDGKAAVPTVGDFVQLLKKHQYSAHKFIHQVCKNGTEITGWYLEWADEVAKQFRRKDNSNTIYAAGDLTDELNKLYNDLPEASREKMIPILNLQTEYLDETHTASLKRLESVVQCAPSKNPAIAKIVAGSASRPGSRPASRAASPVPGVDRLLSSFGRPPSPTSAADDSAESPKSPLPPPSVNSDPGPGAYLARWQDLLDSTTITPLEPRGDIKSGTSKEVVDRSATDADGQKMVELAGGKGGANKVKETSGANGEKLKKPDVSIITDALGGPFRKLLAEQSVDW